MAHRSCFVVLIAYMPETSAANILYCKAKRLREATGNERYRSQAEIGNDPITAKDRFGGIARAFTLAFTELVVLAVYIYSALLYGVLYQWFVSFPLVFGDIYGFSVSQQGLVFLGILRSCERNHSTM